MNILKYDDIREDLINYFRSKSILPIIGSGFSLGEKAKNGNVPSGQKLKEHMIDTLSHHKDFSSNEAMAELKNKQFSEVASFFEDDEYVSISDRRRYYENNFTEVELSEEKKQFLEIDWDYIYTLNIDDSIEKNSKYKKTIVSNRKPFSNIFDEKRLIKLHGDAYDFITYEDSSCRIFTEKEYALSIKTNANLLTRLEHDLANQNVLYIGCSLDDEFDLLTVSNLPSKSDKVVRKIIFSLQKPNVFQKQKYKDFKITDVVVLNSYDELYTELYKTWIESKKIQEDELVQFCNLTTSRLTQVDDNSAYFYYGKSLLDIKNNHITFPFYFIERELIQEIDNALVDNNIILIEGSALSGKSYLLAGVYEYEKKSKLYLFDSRNRIRASSFTNLMKTENSILLFDIGALERYQFDFILNSVDVLNKQNLKVIVLLSYDRSDMFGLVKLKIINGEIDRKYIKTLGIKKNFSHGEIKNINELLPKVDIPVFFDRNSILDNVISIHKKMKKGKFHDIKLRIEDYKELVSLIILITKERISKLDQIRFGIEMECAAVCSRYPKVIEEIETILIEKDAVDLSNYKYILNAKVWLQTELINFASIESNHEIIIEAYQYIVQKILLLNNGFLSGRESYREYILFDSINNIFDNGQLDNLSLILNIYERLDKDLANDYQFLHQYAKGLLMLTNKEIAKDDTIKILEQAKTKIYIAESLVKKVMEYKQQNNEDTYRNLITLYRMKFTESLILCSICDLNNYTDLELINNIVKNLYEIFIKMSIDISFMQGADRSEKISRFLSKIIGKIDNKDTKIQINEILTYLINYQAGVAGGA